MRLVAAAAVVVVVDMHLVACSSCSSLICHLSMLSSKYDLDSDSSVNLHQLILDEEEEMRQKKKKLLNALLLATITCSVAVHIHEHENLFYCDRLTWVEHVTYLSCAGPNEFYDMCRMHYPSYMKTL